jgi:sn-glycerol 3-phosphate transport system permease protein
MTAFRAFRGAFVYAILTVLAALMMYPLLYTLLSVFMTPDEANRFPPKLIPSSLYLGNLAAVLKLVPIWRFIANSFIVSTVITIGQALTGAMGAYAFAYMRFRFKPFWFTLCLSTLMIPWEVTIIPNYLTVKQWGWLDSYPGLTVPFLASAFGIFLLRQFFLQLPRELFEAARIDGCGHIRHFTRIALPLSRPALATLAVYAFLQAWNMYLWPLLITNSDKMRTVQIGIGMLQFEEYTVWNLVLAGAAIVLLPSLLWIALGLKQLVRGITAGAVKG